ncbi:MAG: L,D-transpeptidase family protein [Candidatus Latescibacteria bacterium]|nr:L,D-transpeptidase family protein [Candidatus Latescibacterota bacterium]
MINIVKKIISIAILTFFVFSCTTTQKSVSPIHNSRQILLVIAENDSVHAAKMFGFSRTGNTWQQTFTFPVVIGAKGLGWGLGLHDNADSDPAEPVKREGDGKSPMGIYRIEQSYGYLPREMVDTKLPYEKSGPELICVDDVESEYYNLVIDISEKGLDTNNLPSHEEMLRRDDLYKYTIFVEHNTPAKSGAGCCIFLHLWSNEDSWTAGCTAMAEPEMVRLLSWLDPEQNPVLVQLTQKSYKRLCDRWELPDISDVKMQ